MSVQPSPRERSKEAVEAAADVVWALCDLSPEEVDFALTTARAALAAADAADPVIPVRVLREWIADGRRACDNERSAGGIPFSASSARGVQ